MFPFIEAQNPKTTPGPVFLLHHSLLLPLCVPVASVLLAFAKPRLIHQSASLLVKYDSSLRRRCFQSPVSVLYLSNSHLALHIMTLGLCAAVQLWKNMVDSWWTVPMLTLLPEAVCSSVVSDDAETRIFMSYEPHGWVCVVYSFRAELFFL